MLSVRISPGSPRTRVKGRLDDGSVGISLRAAPVDGRANTELKAFLAAEFGTDRSSVRIVRGSRSRRKLIAIENSTRIPGWTGAEAGE
jgi:uncharacterized protein (TIGR00251 family)